MPFISSTDGDLKTAFVTNAWLIDQFVGNQLWGWGIQNGIGSLGDNTILGRSSPVQTVAGGTNWAQVSGMAAIKTDGTLWLWGQGQGGKLGDNTEVSKSSPVQTVAGGNNWEQVSTGGQTNFAVAAIKTDGTLWMWGINGSGQLGDNTIIHRSSPIQTVAGGTNWNQVSMSKSTNAHCGAIKTDGTLWIWGQGFNGQLGNNNATFNVSSPIQTVAGGTNWKQVSCGINHTAAIKTDGTLWTWGNNASGQLGDNTIVIKSSPIQTVTGGTNWKQVVAGNALTAAIKTDGTLWLWGGNSSGGIGDNTIVSKSSPVQTISGGNNWKQVSLGTINNCLAIKTDGTLWSWGNNTSPLGGTIGDNTLVNKSSPVQTVMGGSNWKQVAHGSNTSFAITNG
jgi:hypothetical protein